MSIRLSWIQIIWANDKTTNIKTERNWFNIKLFCYKSETDSNILTPWSFNVPLSMLARDGRCHWYALAPNWSIQSYLVSQSHGSHTIFYAWSLWVCLSFNLHAPAYINPTILPTSLHVSESTQSISSNHFQNTHNPI